MQFKISEKVSHSSVIVYIMQVLYGGMKCQIYINQTIRIVIPVYSVSYFYFFYFQASMMMPGWPYPWL